MARLIDADALLKKQRFDSELVLVVDVTDIRDAPTVDAVEVVYCQDCIRCNKGFCTIRKGSWGEALKVGLHDYCSYGERRDTDVR